MNHVKKAPNNVILTVVTEVSNWCHSQTTTHHIGWMGNHVTGNKSSIRLQSKLLQFNEILVLQNNHILFLNLLQHDIIQTGFFLRIPT